MAQSTYKDNIKNAEQSFENKLYIEAAQSYSKAFFSNHDLGLIRDRYDAARCWALGGDADSAFYQLGRLAKGNFGEYPEIIADTAFTGLHGDSRWAELLKIIKANQQTQDKNLSWQFKKLNKPLVAALDTIYMDDQLPRKQMDATRQKYGESSSEMKSLIVLMLRKDSINQKKIRTIINKYGCPGKEEVGQQGSETLFTVIQHAPLAMQLEYLPLVRKAVKEEKIQASDLAILEDRVAARQGKKTKLWESVKL